MEDTYCEICGHIVDYDIGDDFMFADRDLCLDCYYELNGEIT